MAGIPEDQAVLDRAAAHARRWLVVLHDVVYTQGSVSFESDERTGEIFDRLVAEGTVMPSASVWHGRTVIRFSVSSWRTGDQEVRDTVAAVARAAHVPTHRPTAVGE